MRKWISVLLIITFLFTLIPTQAIAEIMQIKDKGKKEIKTDKKIMKKHGVPYQKKSNEKSSPSTVKYSDVSLIGPEIEDYQYGNSLYYNVLKKLGKLTYLKENLGVNSNTSEEEISIEEKLPANLNSINAKEQKKLEPAIDDSEYIEFIKEKINKKGLLRSENNDLNNEEELLIEEESAQIEQPSDEAENADIVEDDELTEENEQSSANETVAEEIYSSDIGETLELEVEELTQTEVTETEQGDDTQANDTTELADSDEVTENTPEEELQNIQDIQQDESIENELIKNENQDNQIQPEEEQIESENEEQAVEENIENIKKEETHNTKDPELDQLVMEVKSLLKKQKLAQQFKTNRYIVKYKNNDLEEEKSKVKEAISENIVDFKENKLIKTDLLIMDKDTHPVDLVLDLIKNEASTNIEYIQPDYEIELSSNDLYFNNQWALKNQEVVVNEKGLDVNIEPAWEITEGSGVVVGVIDTGIDITHEDLNQNIWANPDEIPDNGIDDDDNGYIDDINGWNFVGKNNRVDAEDQSSDAMHGTNIAGIIAGVKDNEIGIAGTAPQVKIMPLKAFSNGTAYTSDIIAAIEYAKKMGVKIINSSWGMNALNPALEEAMSNTNILFICAAGNNGINIDEKPVSPGSFTLDNVLTVSAINKYGQLAPFANYGEAAVDIAAPGVDIITTAPENDYLLSNGTSISTAFVTGEAALLLSKDKNLSINQIKEKITKSSDHLSSLIGLVTNGNKVNVGNALEDIYPEIEDAIEIEQGTLPPQEAPVNELMELYTSGASDKAWYNTLVGPSTANGINQLKYSAWENLQEVVSPQTGGLLLKQSDIVLPGRNGLNLEIGRIYQSNQSLFGERRMSGDGVTAFNDYSTYYLNRYGLGTGWSFNFPSVQVEEDEGVRELYYHTGSGPIYHVVFTEDPSDSNLEDYTKKDALFERDTSFSNGEKTSKFVFITADQTKRFFADDGRLLGIVDRFGNQITFKHQEYPVANIAPNSDFEYTEALGIWTTNSNYSYDQTTGKDDTTSLKFTSSSSTSASSYSWYMPVLPNTKYILSGYLNSQLTAGTASLTYREYDGLYNEIKQGTLSTPAANNTWEELSQSFETSGNASFIRLEFNNKDAVGTAYLDKVRFDRLWPLISEITDSIGRTVTFAYTDTLYEENASDAGSITVTINDPAQIESVQFTYTKGKWVQNYSWPDWNEERRYIYLNKFDNGDSTTSYDYTEYDEKFSYISKDTAGSYQNSKRPLLTEMQLRNSKVVYQYGLTTKHFGEDGFYETHRVTNRYEVAETDTGYSTNQEFKQSFSYNGVYNSTNYDNETGYPNATSLFEDPVFLFTCTIDQENGLTTAKAFQGKYEYQTLKENSSGEKEITTNEEYDSNFPDLPTKVKIEQIDNTGTNILYVGYTYTDWGGVASKTKPLTSSQFNNAEDKELNTIQYTYEPYHKFLYSQKYYQSGTKKFTEVSSYDTQGRLVSKMNPNGETIQYLYEDANYPGNMTKEIINHADGRTTTTQYDYTGAYNAFPTTITRHYIEDGVAKTSTTQKTYEFIRGNVIDTTDALNHVTSYQYDDWGRITKIINPPSTGADGEYIVEDHFAYGDYIVNEHSNQSAFAVNHYQTKTPVGQTEVLVFLDTNSYYDDHGNLLLSQYYDYEKALWVNQLNEFNSYGQLLWSQDPKGNQTNYDIDEWNRIKSATDAQGNQQVVEYDIYNRTKQAYFIPASTGIAENHYTETYDQWGRVVSRKGYPEGISDPAVIEEKYEYDLAGNLTKLIDARITPPLSNTTP